VEMRREVGEGVTEAGLNRPTSSARSRPEDRARRSRAGSGGFGSNEELARNTLDKWEQEQPQQIEEQEELTPYQRACEEWRQRRSDREQEKVGAHPSRGAGAPRAQSATIQGMGRAQSATIASQAQGKRTEREAQRGGLLGGGQRVGGASGGGPEAETWPSTSPAQIQGSGYKVGDPILKEQRRPWTTEGAVQRRPVRRVRFQDEPTFAVQVIHYEPEPEMASESPDASSESEMSTENYHHA